MESKRITYKGMKLYIAYYYTQKFKGNRVNPEEGGELRIDYIEDTVTGEDVTDEFRDDIIREWDYL